MKHVRTDQGTGPGSIPEAEMVVVGLIVRDKNSISKSGVLLRRTIAHELKLVQS